MAATILQIFAKNDALATIKISFSLAEGFSSFMTNRETCKYLTNCGWNTE